MDKPSPRSLLHGIPLGSRSILREILVRGPRSRTDLAEALGLTLSNVTRLTRPLVTLGVLVETPGERVESLGRPRMPLDVAIADHHVIGVKLTADHLYMVRTDLRAQVLGEVHEPLVSTSPDAVADQIARLTQQLAVGEDSVRGIGVTLGGHAPDRSTVAWAPWMGWSDIPFGDLVSERTGVAATVDNDVAGLTGFLHWFGSARGLERFAVITIGAGIGFALVTHNRIVRSRSTDIDGLGQHLVDVGEGSALMPVGSRLASSAISEQASAAYGDDLSYSEVLALARAGDPACCRVVDVATDVLARLIASVADFALVENVVLSGEGVELATQQRGELRAAVRRLRPTSDGPELDIHGVDFTEWARGAAVLAIQEFVAAPATVHPPVGG